MFISSIVWLFLFLLPFNSLFIKLFRKLLNFFIVPSVQHRWERVVSKSAERTRALDHGYKEAKEFHDLWLLFALIFSVL